MAQHANNTFRVHPAPSVAHLTGVAACFFLIALISPQAARAETSSSSYRLTAIAASDWLYHGTTETLENPALGINLEWDLGRGMFFGMEGHQAIENQERQRQRGASAYIGVTYDMGADWLLTPAFSYRVFPGSVKEWDFAEYSLDILSPLGVGLRLDYSPDYYRHQSRSFVVEARYLRAIGDSRHYWFANAGSVKLSNPIWNDHYYAQAGFGTSVRALNIEVTAHWNNQGEGRSFGREPYSDPGMVLRFAYRLR